MANGNVISGSSGGSYRWYSTLNATKTSETATSVTYSVSLGYYTRWAISSYANGAMSGAASGSWSGTMTGTNSGTSRTVATTSVTFSKGSSAQTKTVSGYIRVTGGFGNGTSSVSLSISVPAITYSAPTAPSACAASRVSDAQAKVTWTNGSTSTTQPRSSVLVERQTDGGTWSQIASVGASTTNYTDNTISANHRYAYRVRSYGSGGYSGYSTSGYIYTTPASPASVTITKTSGTEVSVAVDTSTAPYATAWDVQESLNGGSWTDVGSYTTFPQPVDVGGGTAKLRVRSTRDDLASDWTESAEVTTIVAPNAPTITSKPAAVVPLGDMLFVEWKPNHPDGSEQSAAQVGWTFGSAPEEIVDIYDGTTYTDYRSFEVGTVKVRVRTKGIAEDWGAWSSYYTFSVAVPPEAHFTVPGIDGAKVGDLPLTVEWEVNDSTGVAAQTLQLLDAAGTVLHTATPATEAREYELGASTYQLANATAYTLLLTVRGGSSLSVTTERQFSTSFAEPARPTADVQLDADTLSQAVTVFAGTPSSDEAEVLEVEATPGTLVPGFSIFGATRQNLWVNPSTKTQNGVTITANDDGSISLSGTATALTLFYTITYNLIPGTEYCISVSNEIDGASFNIRSYGDGGDLVSVSGNATSEGTAFTTDSSALSYGCCLVVASGATVSGTYRVMLNEGSTAEPWCPPGINGVEPEALVTAGKNLLPVPKSGQFMANGITFTADGNGGIEVSGTSTARSQWDLGQISLIPGDYTLSGAKDGEVNIYLKYSSGGTTKYVDGYAYPDGEVTFSIDDAVSVYASIDVRTAGQTVATVLMPQLEFGTEATVYEPPVTVTSTAIDMQGQALYEVAGQRDVLSVDAAGAKVVEKNTHTQTLDGSENWEHYTSNTQYFTIGGELLDKPQSNGMSKSFFCDILPCLTSSDEISDIGLAWSSSEIGVSFTKTKWAKNVYINVPGATDLQSAKDWLAEHPVTITYATPEPETVELDGAVVMPEYPADPTTMWAVSDVPGTVRVDYPDTDALSVTRVLADGSRWLVADGMQDGEQAIDPLPPLNTAYSYEVTASTAAGSIVTASVPQRIDSRGRMALNFGQAASVAHVMGANSKVSYDESADGELYHFADGGESGGLPQFYGTGDIDASGSVSFELMDRAERDRFKRSARLYSVGWFRDAMGGRIRAKMDYGESISAGGIAVWDEDVDMDELIFEEAW